MRLGGTLSDPGNGKKVERRLQLQRGAFAAQRPAEAAGPETSREQT